MNLIGACGDDCSYCPRYKPTLSNSKEGLKKVRQLWISLGLRGPDITADELKCYGCQTQKNCAYQQLRGCAFNRNFENCGMCKDYPCQQVNAAFSKTADFIKSKSTACCSEDMETLIRAFGNKKGNLDRISLIIKNEKACQNG